jgi:acylphosphatase
MEININDAQQVGDQVRVRIMLQGYVQGVGFRWFLHQKAEEAGVTGFVRSLDDGRLEAVFEGNRDQVDEMLSHARNGPDMAKVDNIDIMWELPEGRWDELEITY